MSSEAPIYNPAAAFNPATGADAAHPDRVTPQDGDPAPRFTRTQLVLAVTAVLALLAAGGVALLLLTTGSQDDGLGVRPVPAVTASSTPSATATTATTAAPATAGTARNPFVPPGTSGASGGSAGGTGTGSTPAVTVTQTVTVSPSATPAALYLGLYGWTGTKASFRVNDTQYLEPAGQTFGQFFKFVSATTVGSQQCAKVLFGDVTTTVCPGEVRQVR